MNQAEVDKVSDRFGDTYNAQGNGTQMAWGFESGAQWMNDALVGEISQLLEESLIQIDAEDGSRVVSAFNATKKEFIEKIVKNLKI